MPMKRNPDPDKRSSSRTQARPVRAVSPVRRISEPVKPAIRHTHPRTGRIVLIGSFSRGVPPFVRNVHNALAERLLADGFCLQLSTGKEFRDWERAEGILITDPAWLTPEQEAKLRSGQRGFVLLSMKKPGPNTIFLDASGAWLYFLQTANQRKTNRILVLETKTSEGMPSLIPPLPLLKIFTQKDPPLFQELPKDAAGQNTLPAELMTDDTCLLTDDADAALRFSGDEAGSAASSGFWTACMLPGCEMPAIRDRSFRADPESAAREMQRSLYRQMTTGNTSDPGDILPILWGSR